MNTIGDNPISPPEVVEPETVSEDAKLKGRLLALLPEDGTTRPNAELRVSLGVNKGIYWRVRELLVDEGVASRGRGRGGSTARVLESVPESAVSKDSVEEIAPDKRLQEEELYQPLKTVLEGDWQADKGYEYLAVEDIARAGSRATGGKWTRPDLVAAEVQVFTYLPTKVLSVHTFEVKPSDMIDVTAVYEALAHRRAATHAYVLLHVPDDSQPTRGLDGVIAEARRHGIGVVVFSDPEAYETWDERVVAERVEPEPDALNEFVRIQLPEAARNKIEKAVR